jgi:uncharacterized membrane protein YdjX (TVP38/TMEM64 family)
MKPGSPSDKEARQTVTTSVATPSPALKRAIKIILLALAFTVFVLFFELHADRYLTMQALRDHETWMHESYRLHPLETVSAYCAISFSYVVLALPAAALVMLLAGALFGPALGTALCAISTSLGAVLSMLLSRFLFRGFVQRRFSKQVAIVEREYARNGSSYLIAMRLIPVLPYFVTNLVFGLTPMPPFRFWITTLLASIPAIFIYANAGAELSKVQTLSDVFTWRLALTFGALACLPFVGRFVTNKVLHLRKLSKSTDRDLR